MILIPILKFIIPNEELKPTPVVGLGVAAGIYNT